MTKFASILASLAVAVGLLTSCTTVQNLTPSQIATVGVVITQTSETGAAYAIQQDKRNAQYFILADAAIDTFVVSTNASPAAFEAALNSVAGTNQWVSLAIGGAVVAYDLAVSEYVTAALTNTPAVTVWASDIEVGFKQALASTGTGLKTAPVPYFIKNGAVDRVAIKAKLDAVKK